MRWGECDEGMLEFLNEECGEEVPQYFIDFISQANKELSEDELLKEVDNIEELRFQINNLHSAQPTKVEPKNARTLTKLKHYWIAERILRTEEYVNNVLKPHINRHAPKLVGDHHLHQYFSIHFENSQVNHVLKKVKAILEQTKKDNPVYALIASFSLEEGLSQNDKNSIFAELKNIEKAIERETNLQEELKVTKGMNVIFTANDIDPFIANNMTGTIVKIYPSAVEEGKVECIEVSTTLPTSAQPYIVKVKPINRRFTFLLNDITRTVVRTQFPLKLAVAASTYSVQGLSMTIALLFNNERITKDGSYGAAYTIFSRPPSPAYIKSVHPLTKADIVAHPRALQFDKYHYNKSIKQQGLGLTDWMVTDVPSVLSYFMNNK